MEVKVNAMNKNDWKPRAMSAPSCEAESKAGTSAPKHEPAGTELEKLIRYLKNAYDPEHSWRFRPDAAWQFRTVIRDTVRSRCRHLLQSQDRDSMRVLQGWN